MDTQTNWDAKFGAWISRIDRIIEASFGLCHKDFKNFPDLCFHDEFDAGTSPRDMVMIIIGCLGIRKCTDLETLARRNTRKRRSDAVKTVQG